jgi:hypothetical protein
MSQLQQFEFVNEFELPAKVLNTSPNTKQSPIFGRNATRDRNHDASLVLLDHQVLTRLTTFLFNMKASYNLVNRHNLQTLSFAIKHAIQQSEFIALDTEFTGLGDVKKSRDQNIEDRYIALTELAKEYAVIAVGLSTFKKDEQGNYIVNNFHFALFSVQDHKVSPSSISFLVEHGFDFNDQYRNGIPYRPGNDVEVFPIN